MGLISTLAPGWALKRAMARLKLQRIEALYESARPSRTHPLRGNNLSANSVMARTDGRLRNIARWLDENHDLAISLFNDLETWIIGEQLTVEPMVRTTNGEPATELNTALAAAYADWSEAPDTSQTLSAGSAERLACRSWLRDGEMLTHHVVAGRYPYPTDIPYAVELLEADYLPFELTEPARQGRARVVQGIGVDDWHRPVSYHLWKNHPGNSGYALASSLSTAETKTVPADRISHLRFSRRIGQLRGVPIIHGVIRRMEDIKSIEDAERIAMQVDSDLTLILTNMAGWGEVNTGQAPTGEGEPPPPVREMEMGSGMQVTLAEGENVTMHAPTRPNAKLVEFLRSQHKMVSRGASARFSSVSGDYDGTYSAQRQELVEGFVGYKVLRSQFISGYSRPVWRRFVPAAILARGLSLRGIDNSTLFRADIRGPAMPWIDPAKELDYRVGSVEARLASRRQTIRDMGGDPDTVDQQIAQDETGAPSENRSEDGDDVDAGAARYLRGVQ